MRKKFRQFCENLKWWILILLPLIVAIGITLLGIWVSYEIATSDLPDWFKFFLLK